MNDILTDLSAQALVKAIKHNRFEWYGYTGRSPEAELYASPYLTWLLTEIPIPLMNTVIHTHLSQENADDIIEKTLAHFKSENVTRFTWWVEPDSQPTDLGERLLGHGFTYEQGPPGMAVDLSALNEDIQAPPNLSIEQVDDAGALKQWVATLIHGFELPDSIQEKVSDLMAGLGFDLPSRKYLGFLKGELVALAELFLGAGVAGIYAVATLPEARRQGIGAAMTLAPLIEARALGYRIGILHATDMGLRVYRRLGFQEYCKMSYYKYEVETND
jgi:ribosomal protein S18 acetylase RimI-like enzyme